MPAMVEAQPWPVSPSPWRKMTVAVCLPLGATTTGSGMVSSRAAAEAELAAGWSLDLVHFPPIHRQHGQGPHHRAAALCNREGKVSCNGHIRVIFQISQNLFSIIMSSREYEQGGPASHVSATIQQHNTRLPTETCQI